MDKYVGKQILVTGHSLGAAVAQIASLEIFSYGNATGYRMVEDFGSPRWGNSVMVDYFVDMVDTHWRLTNQHDVVPTVPPESKWYKHTPTQVWYTSDEPLKYQVCDGSGEDKDCSYFGDRYNVICFQFLMFFYFSHVVLFVCVTIVFRTTCTIWMCMKTAHRNF